MTTNQPIYGVAYDFNVSLESQATPGTIQENPTLAAGDVKVSKDNGAMTNLASLPTVTPASGPLVKVSLSAAEMTADRVSVRFKDAAGDEWYEHVIHIEPVRIPFFTVDDSVVTPTTTVFDTDLTSTTDSFYNNLWVHFLTGSNAGQSREITGYDGTTNVGKITVTTAFAAAPSNGDKGIILGHA